MIYHMKLIENWREVAKKSWSFLAGIIAAAFSVLEVMAPILAQHLDTTPFAPPGTFAGLAGVVAAVGAGARLLKQKNMEQK